MSHEARIVLIDNEPDEEGWQIVVDSPETYVKLANFAIGWAQQIQPEYEEPIWVTFPVEEA